MPRVGLMSPLPEEGAGLRTYEQITWSVDELIAAKSGRTVSVVLPALNEEATVAGVIDSIAPLAAPSGRLLVDEVVLVDSGSTDRTREVARDAGREIGIRVVELQDVLAGCAAVAEPRRGKGEALWRSLAATRGDVIAFIDTDLHNPSSAFVLGIIGPLLLDPELVLVKGYYQRPYRSDLAQGSAAAETSLSDDTLAAADDPYGGGRVTELAARPLLELLAPELRTLRQPLAGEYAVRRDFALSVPFAAEYGVEIGLVLDAVQLHGTAAIAQVNLGVREHRHRSLRDLAVTSRQVMETAFRRLGIHVPAPGLLPDRPPMRSIADDHMSGNSA